MTGFVGVVGGGQMGAGIAEVLARHGFAVRLVEQGSDAAKAAHERVQRSLARAVERGKATAEQAGAALAAIRFGSSWQTLDDADVVIEAVPEDEALKRDVFARLGAATRRECILASNTSSIPIARLAAASHHPDRVIGMHFFQPVAVMKLVEVVPAQGTSEATIAAAEALAARLECTTIRAQDRAGFIVNGLLVPYLLSAIRMLEGGHATADDIDTGMVLGCGHPMGPLSLADFIGLDTLLAIAEAMHAEYDEPALVAPSLLRRLVEGGLLGRKTGHGFREY